MTLSFDQVRDSLLYAFRSLLKNRGFFVTALLSLALGIGATTAIFSVIYGVILDPFPYAHPETLMSMQVRQPSHNLVFYPYSPDQYLDIAEHNRIFEGVNASTISDVLFAGEGNPERLRGNYVTTNAFPIMGVAPYLGRYITPSDGAAQAAPVVVLGYTFWRRHFAGDPRVLGKQLRLNDKVRTVIGVMPPRFMWRGADVYLPVVFQRGKVIEGVRFVMITGRLKPGVSSAQASSDLHPIFEDILSRTPAYRPAPFTVTLTNFYETYPSSIRKQLWILLGAVSLLLLIACANVSNLMLARAAARGREIAIRAALGAGRLRIASQLLIESLVLGFLSALLGIAFAFGMLRLVVAIIPPDTIPAEAGISLNLPVLLFTLAVSLSVAVLFGIAPALQATKTDLAGTLKATGRGLAGNMHESRLRAAFVIGEVAVAMLLLLGASLVVRTLINLQNVRLGYDPRSVLSVQLPLSEKHYPTPEARNLFMTRLTASVQSIPGVRQIAVNTFVHPFANWGMRVEVPGSAVHQDRPAILSQVNDVYPAMLHIPLLEGRLFTASELELKRHDVLINETLAHTYFGKGSPIGRQLRIPELKEEPSLLPDDVFTVVGVLADIRNVGLDQAVYPEVFMPFTVTGFSQSFIHPTLLVTAQVPPLTLVNQIEQRVHAIDRDQPVMLPMTVEKLLDQQGFAGPRFSVFLFSVFAVLGLAICSVGIYGVINYSVARRLPSLGIRVALGAGRSNLISLVFRETLQLVLTGVALGVLLGLVATRWLASLIWGVSPLDPLSFFLVTTLLLLTGISAALIPAWRAAHVDPMLVLRHE